MTPLAFVRLLTPAFRSAADLASWWMFRTSGTEWFILARSFAGSIRLIWRTGADQDGNQPE